MNSNFLPETEKQEFRAFWPALVKDVLSDPSLKDIHNSVHWLEKVLNYNVPHGKQNRGLAFIEAFRLFSSENRTKISQKRIFILGWCIEILQGSFLVADDIMDESTTRRGKPCWYKVEGVGLMAVNDFIMLEQVVYYFISKYFGKKRCYSKIMEIFHDVSFKTTLGQCLDTISSNHLNLDEFSYEKYAAIVKYKTSYYTFYLPIALALTLAKVSTDAKSLECIEQVLLRIGYLFQVQDDYLDCFGDPSITGKIGTDIRDGKCTWLVLKALELGTNYQTEKLKECYGVQKEEYVNMVKNIYTELDLAREFNRFEFEAFEEIKGFVQANIPPSQQQCFVSMLNSIFGRQK